MEWFVSCGALLQLYKVIQTHSHTLGAQNGKTSHLPTGCQSSQVITNPWYTNGKWKYTGLFYNNCMCCKFLNKAMVITLLGYHLKLDISLQFKTLLVCNHCSLAAVINALVEVLPHTVHVSKSTLCAYTHNITFVSDKSEQRQ